MIERQILENWLDSGECPADFEEGHIYTIDQIRLICLFGQFDRNSRWPELYELQDDVLVDSYVDQNIGYEIHPRNIVPSDSSVPYIWRMEEVSTKGTYKAVKITKNDKWKKAQEDKK